MIDPDIVSALFHPLRGTLLDLLLERAATVKEMAAAVQRPPSSVAYHVDVLLAADLARVVRTRRVRGIDERFYGRTARLFTVGRLDPDQYEPGDNPLAVAANESGGAHQSDDLRAIHRHVRIPAERIAEFWSDVLALADRLADDAGAGDTTVGFVAGIYPTEFPTLPPADHE